MGTGEASKGWLRPGLVWTLLCDRSYMTEHHVDPQIPGRAPGFPGTPRPAGPSLQAHRKQSGYVNSYSKPRIRHHSVCGILIMASFRVQDSFFFFLAGLDLSSLTRDQTQALDSENRVLCTGPPGNSQGPRL